ncbi:nitronate monooxygenase [Dyadobacter chenwenxiniae]|uniref:Propionate 3-nitronate monooxygenase n=1 Tax=Dyadobacter chenwenxiniae TaxID=2906456 RepID=A0A9X1THI5_9BACT|nr:nitronate monooxygenase [Dyadobacter chenwenxiniae]MCF0065172.1 nitronate monooxygenase [Dyadobacter chenwenxiniae]UON84558.1 nitronate monooxygenase [Dyadobacter chenwenxiniae]
MENQTKITALLGIRYPILQGPMGGGFSNAELLAAVSNAGGLGSFGAYTLTPEQILAVDKEIKSKTNQPYNINLWVSDVDDSLKDYSAEKLDKLKQLFKPYFDSLSIPLPDLDPNIPSKFLKQVEAVFEARPAVFSFIFGIPPKEILDEARRLGIKTVGAATTLDEGLALEQAGVDAIVASGFEAGGHRPSFLKPAHQSLTGTFSLVQHLKAKIKTPVIAAGGIKDGKGIKAALSLGADAAQLGTAFLVTEESNATPTHRAMLLSDEARYTVLSKSLTGRMGRIIRNRITEEVSYETEVLPFPLQSRFMGPLREAAQAQGRTDLGIFWSGQNAVNLKAGKAAELMQSLINEAFAD